MRFGKCKFKKNSYKQVFILFPVKLSFSLVKGFYLNDYILLFTDNISILVVSACTCCIKLSFSLVKRFYLNDYILLLTDNISIFVVSACTCCIKLY